MRQSPISSRKRSTTMVRSVGKVPVACTCSSIYMSRFLAASGSRQWRSTNMFSAPAVGCISSSRIVRKNSPTACPSSTGRPSRSPCQNGILPGSPGAGLTMTRSNDTSSIRQVEAPSTNVSPGRVSYTISSSSSPTRVPSGKNTPNMPRSGIVPPLVTANRCAPSRARNVSAMRSHTMRGRKSRNSSLGYRPANKSSTLLRTSSDNSAKLAHRRIIAVTEATLQSGCMATCATMCWANTSSGLRRYLVDSMSASNMRRATTATSSKSCRCFGNTLPLLASPTECPARPMRCRPRLTAPGDST